MSNDAQNAEQQTTTQNPTPDSTDSTEVASNNAEQGAGQHEPTKMALLENESLAAFASRVNRPVDMVRYANAESVAPDQSINEGVTELTVPELL